MKKVLAEQCVSTCLFVCVCVCVSRQRHEEVLMSVPNV